MLGGSSQALSVRWYLSLILPSFSASALNSASTRMHASYSNPACGWCRGGAVSPHPWSRPQGYGHRQIFYTRAHDRCFRWCGSVHHPRHHAWIFRPPLCRASRRHVFFLRSFFGLLISTLSASFWDLSLVISFLSLFSSCSGSLFEIFCLIPSLFSNLLFDYKVIENQ